ncbi:hypothetical protein BD560DRAFT_405849 [Blakeslea trispora]|nr:hypothetical protein BD560DRAFT_405849 [Blakeslea trispora]
MDLLFLISLLGFFGIGKLPFLRAFSSCLFVFFNIASLVLYYMIIFTFIFRNVILIVFRLINVRLSVQISQK